MTMTATREYILIINNCIQISLKKKVRIIINPEVEVKTRRDTNFKMFLRCNHSSW